MNLKTLSSNYKVSDLKRSKYNICLVREAGKKTEERMKALLVQFNNLRAKQDENDILGLPELKVPEVIAGPYGALAHQQRQEEDVRGMLSEARNLQKVSTEIVKGESMILINLLFLAIWSYVS